MDEFTPIIPDDPDDAASADRRREAAIHARWSRGRPRREKSSAVKLVMLLAMLLMVIWAMRVAGRAESWRWLIPADGAGEGDAAQPDGDFRNERLEGARFERDPLQVDARDEMLANATGPGAPQALTKANESKKEFLRQFLQSIPGTEQTEFFQVVRLTALQTALPKGETAVAARLVAAFRSHWEAWQGGDGEDDAGDSRTREWGNSILSAMDALIDRPDPRLIDDAVAEFPGEVRSAADSLVSQFTQVGRPVEAYAWTAAWSDVFDQPMSPDESGIPAPTITQLLAQPDEWGGRMMVVRGTALRVERVRAGKNPLGIEEYHVLWIRPDHPSSFPLCLYALLSPESLTPGDGENSRDVNAKVSAVAEFFKVRLFDSGKGAAQAPLLMTATVQVKETTSRGSVGSPISFGPLTFAAIVVLVAAVAIGLAWLVWRASSGGKSRGELPLDRVHSAMDQLRDDPQVETVREKLKRMAGDDGSEF